MAQPTDPLVIWASDNVILPISEQQNKIKPQDALIATGWDKTQKPSAEEFNYILNNLSSWIAFLKEDDTGLDLTAYMRKDQNLNDLANKSTARTNLNVYSKSDWITSLSTNSFAKLPNGLIIQGGSGAALSHSFHITYPMSFPSRTICAMCIKVSDAGARFLTVDQVTSSGFNMYGWTVFDSTPSGNIDTYQWFAIGH